MKVFDIVLILTLFFIQLAHSILPVCLPEEERCVNVTCPPVTFCNGQNQAIRIPNCGCCPVCYNILGKVKNIFSINDQSA